MVNRVVSLVAAATSLLAVSSFGEGRVILPDAYHDNTNRVFSGISSLALSPKNGRLWVTWYGGPTDGEDSNNYVVLATSADDGRTWKEVLIADPDGLGPVRSFDPEVWVAPDGRLRWTWSERKVALRQGSKNRFNDDSYQAALNDRLYLVELDAEHEPSGPLPAGRCIGRGVMMCKPLVDRKGRWLFPSSHWQDDPSACVLATEDAGRTFSLVGGATLPPVRRLYDEHNLLELKDGSLRSYIRVSCGRVGIWQADSTDGGRTWSKAEPAPFKQNSSRIFVRKLQSGAWLLVKNGDLDWSKTRERTTAYVSDDEGRTWTGGLLLHEEQSTYPDGDQAPDGTIYVTYDTDRVENRAIYFSTFTEADVRAGKDVSGKVRRDVLITVKPTK